MYRFVLLSINFNLNMVYLYLTFSPLSESVSCYTMLVVAGRSLHSVGVCLYDCLSCCFLKTRAAHFCVPPFLLIQSEYG